MNTTFYAKQISLELSESRLLQCRIFLDDRTFAYALIKNKQVVMVKHYQLSTNFVESNEQIESLITSDIFLQSKFKHVEVRFLNRSFELIPESIKIDTLDYASHESLISTYDTQLIGAFDAQVKIDYFDSRIKTIQKYIDISVIRHAYPIIVNQFYNDHANAIEDKLCIAVVGSNLVTLMIKSGVAIHESIYEIDCAEDVLYYVSLIYETYGMQTKKDILIVYGDFKKTDSYFSLLEQYISKVYFGNRPKNLKFTEEMDLYPYHYFYSLYTTTE